MNDRKNGHGEYYYFSTGEKYDGNWVTAFNILINSLI